MKTLKYALRYLLRAKSYTIINLLGLSFSLACSIILLRYIHQEQMVDSHAIHPESIYMPIRDVDGNVHPGSLVYADTAYFAPECVIERSTFISMDNDNVTIDDKPYSAQIMVTDSAFFNFFYYPLSAGECLLKAPEDALVTQAFARRVFGNQNPIGKTLQYSDEKAATIRGVLDESKCKSSFVFDVILHRTLRRMWSRLDGEFIRFASGVDVDAINAVSNVYKSTPNGNMRYRFLPLTEHYWDGELAAKERARGMRLHGSRSHILMLTGVCLLLLFGGILNFVNIYMVSMMKRTKEYGVRKVFGIDGRSLFVQLWAENVVLFTVALFFAWVIIEVSAQPVAHLLQGEVAYTTFDLILSIFFWLLLPLVTVIYPYFRYKYQPPIVSIRALATTRQSVITRMSFLFVQYVITFLLIILSLYFGNHLQFLLNTPPGFRVEGVLSAELLHDSNDRYRTTERIDRRQKRTQQIEQKLDECPLIEKWTTMNYNFIGEDNSSLLLVNDKGDQVNMEVLFVSPDFFSIYELEPKEGTLPAKNQKWRTYSVVMNESALKAFGYTRREDAFVRGKSPLWTYIGTDNKRVEDGMELMPVTAVIPDYYAGHITAGKRPIIYLVSSRGSGKYYIVCSSGKEKALIEYLTQVEKEVYGTEDFTYSWLKDEVKAIYNQDQQVATVYLLFAFISIIISCLGLFGLSLFDIRQRYREIAIRKINGAQLKNLYPLLCRKYILILAGAFAVASPIAYFAIDSYTEDFVVKSPIGISIFLIALLVVTSISLGTLLWQVRKATRINPSIIMKSE